MTYSQCTQTGLRHKQKREAKICWFLAGELAGCHSSCFYSGITRCKGFSGVWVLLPLTLECWRCPDSLGGLIGILHLCCVIGCLWHASSGPLSCCSVGVVGHPVVASLSAIAVLRVPLRPAFVRPQFLVWAGSEELILCGLGFVCLAIVIP